MSKDSPEVNIPKDPKLPKAMVSFSSYDSRHADKLENQLSRLGIKLLRYEQGIEPQQQITRFVSGFSDCDVAFVILSAAYFKSPICIFELISIANIPDKAFLITVPESGEGLTSIAASSLDKMKMKCSCRKSTDWIDKLLSTIEWDRSIEAVRYLLTKRFLPASQISSQHAVRSYLKVIGYTPESFAKTLHTILTYNDLVIREKAFDEYLETGCRGDSFLYAKAVSYEMAGYYKLALSYLSDSLTVSPDYAASYVRICRIALSGSTEIQDEALELLDHFHPMESIDNADLADVYRAIGLLLLKKYKECHDKNQLIQANDFFKKSEQIEKTSAILNNLAQIQEALQDPKEARNLYKEAIRLDNTNYFALNNLALLLFKYEHNPDAAKKLFKRALKFNPNYQPSINGLALACEDESPEDSMLRYLEIACLDYKLSEALTNAALVAEEKFAEPKTARTLYKLALLKNPEGLAPNYNYATFLRRSGAPTKEVEYYYNIAKKAGENILIDIGYILLRLRDGELNDAALRMSSLPNMVSPQAMQAAGFLRLHIALNSDTGLCLESLANLLPADEIEFWPYAELAGRAMFKARRQEASGYSRKAKSLREAFAISIDNSSQDDFSPLFDFFETQMPHIFNERIARRQIIRIDDNPKQRIANETAKRVNDV